MLSLSCGTSSRGVALGEGTQEGTTGCRTRGIRPGIGTMLSEKMAPVGAPTAPCRPARPVLGVETGQGPSCHGHSSSRHRLRPRRPRRGSAQLFLHHPRLADTGVRTGASLQQAGGPGERAPCARRRSSVNDRRDMSGAFADGCRVISIAIGSATHRLAQEKQSISCPSAPEPANRRRRTTTSAGPSSSTKRWVTRHVDKRAHHERPDRRAADAQSIATFTGLPRG